MHLTLLGVALDFTAPKEHVRVLGITFGSAPASNLQMRKVEKKNLHTTSNHVQPSSQIPSESLKEVLSSQAEATSSDSSLDQDVTSISEAQNAKTTYFALITQIIYRNKRYPRQAYSLQQEGLVVVKLKLNKDGEILDLRVLEESPYKSLNEASLDTISAIHRFPPIPNELGVNELTLRVPIEYKIRL